MAVSINSTRRAVNTTRRQMFAAAGGVAAAAAFAMPAAASEPLEGLWGEYDRLRVALDAADDAWMEARRQCPEPPECICRRMNRAGEPLHLAPLDPEELQQEFEQAVKLHGKEWAERIYGPRLQAMEEWQSACAASDKRHRVDEREAKVHDLFERSSAVLEEILNTPPRTARGIVVWLRVMELHMQDAPSEPESEWTVDQRVMRRLLPAVRALC